MRLSQSQLKVRCPETGKEVLALAENSRYLYGHQGRELPPPPPDVLHNWETYQAQGCQSQPTGSASTEGIYLSQNCLLAFLWDSAAEPEHICEHRPVALPLPSQSLKDLAFNYKSKGLGYPQPAGGWARRQLLCSKNIQRAGKESASTS